MKIFCCDNCGHPVFFENVRCLHCGSELAFLPDRLDLAAVEPASPDGDDPAWRRMCVTDDTGQTGETLYRPCRNRTVHEACNFAVRLDDPNPLCVSCRQTRMLPDLSVQAHLERWYRIEVAKRRLYYSLARLGIVKTTAWQTGEPEGPVYEFLADQPGKPRVLTGHHNGVITLNVAEADDDERTRRRLVLHEPYRTLLGHLRHESGHYYWNELILAGGRLQACRDVFGDDSIDYGEALNQHYANGAGGSDWQEHHVSAYATAHPWEDWAETWAHYLHMVDLLETAASYSTKVMVPGSDSGNAEEVTSPFEPGHAADFDQLVTQWVPVTLMLNSLNRSLGQNDAYPFALTPGALRKLRFVHDVIEEAAHQI